MSNMSYCRFQNTFSDLYDCVNAIGDIIAGDPPDGMEDLCRRYLVLREEFKGAKIALDKVE